MSEYQDQVEIGKAAFFAKVAHAAVGQLRKYTNEPYFVHPEEVANIVRTVDHTPIMLMASYLHDTKEDTLVTLEMIAEEFGPEVASYVDWLTDKAVSSLHGNRADRKLFDRLRLAGAPNEVKTIKLADLISNTTSIVAHDPKFAKVYLAEKMALLDVLVGGDPVLWVRARKLALDGLAKLEETEKVNGK